MEINERLTWHYAVFMGRSFYMEPACLIIREPLMPDMRSHGMTKIRGDVNCENCLKAMGIV